MYDEKWYNDVILKNRGMYNCTLIIAPTQGNYSPKYSKIHNHIAKLYVFTFND